jgi:hypothetical protein
MTIYEDHQKVVAAARERHRQELDALDAFLKTLQDRCKHKWGDVQDGMFYALGNTAPGKQCAECGAKRHLTDRERSKWMK